MVALPLLAPFVACCTLLRVRFFPLPLPLLAFIYGHGDQTLLLLSNAHVRHLART